MKDQYVADVNDYLKYALLRSLVASDIALSVVWMLTSSDERNDGQRLGYLSRSDQYRRVDPPLFDALHGIVADGTRSVAAIEAAELFQEGVFVGQIVPDTRTPRQAYFQAALEASHGADLVFFDPDNGFEVRSVRPGARQSSKYLQWSEAAASYACGHSLVVYQHFPRRPRSLFLRELANQACEVVGCRRVMALRTGYVAFVVLPQPRHEGVFAERLATFAAHTAPFATGLFDTKASAQVDASSSPRSPM
jgi:hypothetical protein